MTPELPDPQLHLAKGWFTKGGSHCGHSCEPADVGTGRRRARGPCQSTIRLVSRMSRERKKRCHDFW